MKNILITGGTGFIGKNINESFLREKYRLFAPGRAELNLSDDESVAAYFSRHHFDVIIHSAAKPGHRNATDTSSLFFTNSRMVANIFKHRDEWGKFINMGSGAVYDMRHYVPKMKESYFGTHIPADEHGYNKYIFTKLLPTMSNVYDFRIFGIFGKYEDYAIRFISNAICKAIFDLPITLRQNRRFDYLYINDLMPILEYFIEHSPTERSFNITTDSSVDLLSVAELVKKISGLNKDILVAQTGMGMEYSGDNSLLKNEMGNVNFTPLDTAVNELFHWYAGNQNNLDKQLLLTDKT